MLMFTLKVMQGERMAEQETLEMDEILEKILFYSLDQAQAKLEAGEELTPFTVIVDNDQMFEETFPGDDVVTCRQAAESAVKAASAFGSHYVFCYDGFLMTDQGQLDAIMAECATNDVEKAYVIARLYKEEGDALAFEKIPAYIDETDTFFDLAAAKAAQECANNMSQEDKEMEEIQQRIADLLGAGPKDNEPAE